GKVSGCRIEDIVDASHPSRSRIVSLVATHGEDNGFDVEFSNNLIPNMQKGGILLMGPEGQCRLEGNRVEDEPNAALAGNGIQVSYGCRGVLVDNEVSGVDYVGDNWGASGVLLFEPGDVSVSGGTIVDCEMGLNHSQWNWVYTPAGATAIDVSGILVSGGDYGVSTHLGGPGAELDLTVKESRIVGCAYSGVDLWGSDEDPWGGDYYAGWTDGELTALVEGCYIACGEGVVEWVALEPNTVDVTVRDCHLGDDNDYGVYNNYGNTVDARHNWWGHVDGPTLVRQAGSAASPAALPSPFPAGDAEPDMGFAMPPRPRAESEPSRAGVNVSTGVEFDPWRTGNIVCVPDPLFLSVAQPNGDVTVRYLGGGGGLVYGYSVKFAWDGAVVTTGTAQVTEGGLLRDVAGTDGTHFEKRPTGTNEITVDCVLLGDVDGATGPGDMFTVHFTGAAFGQSPVDLTVLAVRDKDNQPLGGFYADDGLIQVDLTNPVVTDVFIENVTLTHTNDWIKDGDAAKVTATVTDDGPLTITADLTGLGGGAAVAPDSYAGNVATWNLASVACAPADGTVTVTVTATDGLSNSANGSDTITADNTKPEALAGLTAMPGHKKVSLAWSDASSKDANYAGVLLRYDRWNGYPTYAPPAPAYPATHAGGLGTAFAGTGTSTDHAFTAFDRDIYYYGGFVYDQARNYSDADAGAQARATNYWLGDVVPNNNWNGYVDTQDISALGGTYYGYTNPQCDVGPTHNGSRRGVPVPSGTIDFEDLMIFAMNYGVVAPQALPPVGVPPTETTG
ncbi:MAG: right-handed parallel beta-helix repeat-containing protein, partial [Candidatus Eisenbacteria bacterium]|nr:right-handed parallel beta-helix repeat-containing protein [Candidatus Eisenbacteria bacterium]